MIRVHAFACDPGFLHSVIVVEDCEVRSGAGAQGSPLGFDSEQAGGA
jgi:hypothetical protein